MYTIQCPTSCPELSGLTWDYHRNGIWGEGFNCAYDPATEKVHVVFSRYTEEGEEPLQPITVNVPFIRTAPYDMPIVDGAHAFVRFTHEEVQDGDFVAVWSGDFALPVLHNQVDPAVAVFNLNGLAEHGVTFGPNSWRGYNMAGYQQEALINAGWRGNGETRS